MAAVNSISVPAIIMPKVVLAYKGCRVKADIYAVLDTLLRYNSDVWTPQEAEFVQSMLEYGDDLEMLLEQHSCVSLGGEFVAYESELH